METKGILNLQKYFKFILNILCLCNVRKLYILFFTFCISIFTYNVFSQSVGIGVTSFTPDPSAILDVRSTTQGAVMPRMSTFQMNAIVSPVTGLIIFNTDCNTFNYYNGSSWVDMLGNTATVNVPDAPVTGTHTPSQTQIVWNWNAVSGATGYKWGTTNVYSSATDNGASTSKTQSSLTCNNNYTLYVWAYNKCGNSTSATLTQNTNSCCTPSTVADGSLTKTTTCGVYTVISWTYSSSPGTTTWTVPSGVASVDYLVVGGGGGGGTKAGGGGGAGEFRTATGFNITPLSTINIAVGAGGAGATVNGSKGVNGGNSIFNNITSVGGGGGGSNGNFNGADGGSGGGGSGEGGSSGGSPTGSYGNAGGSGDVTPTHRSGGGGGGSGSAGVNGASSAGGTGGSGTSSNITGTIQYFSAGGGGGLQNEASTVGAGGSVSGNKIGGDGAGTSSAAGAGFTNTGSGGGGSAESVYTDGGNGASGIVIIRY